MRYRAINRPVSSVMACLMSSFVFEAIIPRGFSARLLCLRCRLLGAFPNHDTHKFRSLLSRFHRMSLGRCVTLSPVTFAFSPSLCHAVVQALSATSGNGSSYQMFVCGSLFIR